ncbi:MAG TPA: ClpX C4-type zinc finger protein [Phycisphaerales bacterium]|nr:ClpX C4-type zinc finger protein [Phycisphaerales bacterium]HMP36255.1 ClpX C4-type zinc finger protein [Phycisphaerales bacterium]
MHRTDCDPENMQPGDFLCDFCARDWTLANPMVEGHHGSLICGSCLSIACAELSVRAAQGAPDERPPEGQVAGAPCTLCLERRAEPSWTSPLRPEAVICRRCTRQAARRLEGDPESGWLRPE